MCVCLCCVQQGYLQFLQICNVARKRDGEHKKNAIKKSLTISAIIVIETRSVRYGIIITGHWGDDVQQGGKGKNLG